MLVSFKRSTRRACVLVLNVWCFVLHSSKSRNGLLLILKCKAKTAWTLHPNCRPLLSSASAPGSGPRSQHCLGLRWQMQTVLWPRNNLTDHCLETCLLQIKVLCIMTQHGPGSAPLHGGSVIHNYDTRKIKARPQYFVFERRMYSVNDPSCLLPLWLVNWNSWKPAQPITDSR